MKQIKKQEPQQSSGDPSVDSVVDSAADQPATVRKRGYLLPLLFFIVILAVVLGAAYQGWILFNQQKQQTRSMIDDLNSQLQQRPTLSQVDGSIRTLRQSVTQTDSRLSELEQGHSSLLRSTEKLYELYGRDENGWKLAEVEYLMSVAQHKLVLENDFEGAAKTLNAASERIAELADPGLLSVRVKINEEIALLKTRVRPDLVGMTLLLSRLTRQITSLKPGYQTQSTQSTSTQTPATAEGPAPGLDRRLLDFMASLVTIKSSAGKVDPQQTVALDVSEKLEDNLKLTRWSVLERDAFQYARLMTQNVDLFKEYYDLENAANADFYESLLKLQKSQLKPELPDIGQSLILLKQLQLKREAASQQGTGQGAQQENLQQLIPQPETTEADNG